MNQFKLKYDSTSIPMLASDYLDAYRDDDQEMEAAGRRLKERYERSDFLLICKWKSPRPIKWLEMNSDADIANALSSALGTSNEREAIKALDALWGVGVKMASAIMTAVFPDHYSVLDFRALNALGVKDGNSLSLYLEYLSYCRDFARTSKIGLRDFDRANWQWSKNQSSSKPC